MRKNTYKPRYKPSRRRKGKSKAKITAAIVLPMIAIGSAASLMMHSMGIEKPDANYCYKRDNQHVSAIFLDNSLGNVSDVHLRDYTAAYERAYDAAPPNTRMLFYSTAKDDSGTVIKPVFSICKPAATPAQQQDINAPEKPAPYLKRQANDARKRYQQAITDMLQKVQDNSKHASDSPILEQIRAISRAPDFQATSRSLTVITDGFENSQVARFCTVEGDMPPFSVFVKRKDYNLSIKPRSFRGTDISFMMVNNMALPSAYMPYCTQNELRTWWVDFFKGNGASDVELTNLRYWAG
jgi:hypothetical protein